MMTDQEIVEQVKKRHPPTAKLEIKDRIPEVLRGQLAVLVVTNGTENRENYYYDSEYETENQTFTSLEALVRRLSERQVVVANYNSTFLDFLTNAQAVAGALALIVAIAVVSFAFATGKVELSGPLSTAFTSIISFFFGVQATRNPRKNSRTTKNPSED